MPSSSLHMTTLEITHSQTPSTIASLLSTLAPSIPSITDYTLTHHPRLLSPMLSYDTSAIALSFLPAAASENDAYTYHHLRRDIYSMCEAAGVEIASRYTVPSAHLTIARFVTQQDILGDRGVEGAKVERLVERIEEVNRWLETEYWPREGNGVKEGGEWVVGQEKGLDCRRGTLWYGGGETVRLGKGF